ncbi:AraC family transcriptional regulator [Hephaestia caeni]|uniref:AraC family transcriptional regulator n=1 Tax=Hephaestia caeni TaxID=645617 RepID=A0A397PEW2_9SPHN|nr:AraC family transcriptional regulator [Hephaestia caeni]RIA45707.1 AraC family transcriptional regulator [Hephaestia caeni]
MALRPICEPVDLPLGTSVLAERVEHRDDSPELGRLLHFHDVSELVIFDAVRGSFLADGRRHAVADGTVVFAPSMRHHDYELAPGAKSWTLIQIDPYIVEHLALQPDYARLARPFAARPDSAQWQRIETLAHWLREVTTANARDPLVIRIVELLLLAVVASPEVEAADAGEDTAYVERLLPAVEYLRRDPGAAVALEEAAAMCNLSPAYFSRRFKRVFGMNFTDYVRTYRLHLAARRILTTGAPVSDIAYGLGFASPSHFTARFHERFGMTPRAYRQSVRRRQDN